LDVENAKRFDITYTDENGKSRYPMILHASISGGIDRCLCALLEEQARTIERGEKGQLPFWLSPTQLRLIPVRDEFLDDCSQIANRLKARIDIDDRDEGVSRKIRDAEKEWIPIIIVYGEKEHESNLFTPRFRSKFFDKEIGKEIGKEKFTLEELDELIKKKMDNYPYEPLPLPIMLSKRPKFRG
jgi:threonyl-tRNA synthetase